MTTHLARTYGLIGLEDLNTKGRLANHCLAQATSDASFFEVKRQLLYKSEQYGGSVQLVDRWYARSKTCHHCGWVKQDLTLADRVWVCEQCGALNEREVKQVREWCERVLLHLRKQIWCTPMSRPEPARKGTYTGRVLVRARGSFDIVTKTARGTDISYKYCRVVQRAEGYRYALGAPLPLST
jgi:IS605 OrfB family transposase